MFAARSVKETLTKLGLSRFLEYSQAAGLTDIVDGTAREGYTLFIPNDEAFRSKFHVELPVKMYKGPSLIRIFFASLI